MKADFPSAFVLVGPTASGKSAVAQWMAEQAGAPLVSADSMNLYRGMDIGTAKPSAHERAKIELWGVDLAEPTESFSVGDWLRAVRPAFQTSEPPPIVAGGTGLYIKCLLQGLDDLPTANDELRQRTENMTLAELQAEAQATAPEAYRALADKENPRRLIRLLEGRRPSEGWKTEVPVVVGLHVEREVLHRRIAERVEKMYADGLLEEARGLIRLELSSTAQHAIGYAEAFAVLRGEMTVAQAKEKTALRTRQLAKRQMTWFRHQLKVAWIEADQFPDIGQLADKVYNACKTSGPVPLAGVRL
jgi:tRNA dimethylallyltransferase